MPTSQILLDADFISIYNKYLECLINMKNFNSMLADLSSQLKNHSQYASALSLEEKNSLDLIINLVSSISAPLKAGAVTQINSNLNDGKL